MALGFVDIWTPIECWVGWLQTLGQFVTIPVWALEDATPQVFYLCHRPKNYLEICGITV